MAAHCKPSERGYACNNKLSEYAFLHLVHFVPELKPRLFFFHALVLTLVLNGADVSGRRYHSCRNYSGPRLHTSAGEPSCAGRQRWETGLHLLFAVDNMRMSALDPRRINQNVLTAQHKGLFSLFFTRNIILLFYW